MARDSGTDQDFDAVNPGEPTSRWGAHALLAVIVMLVVGLILPVFYGRSGTDSRGMQCRNYLRNITLGLVGYKNAHGDWPPARTFDAQGRPLHSWRTLILPFIDQKALYETIDLSKPWDDPANAEAARASLPIYHCPDSLHEPGKTTYLAALRKDGSWILDPSGRPTILIVDVETEQAVPWMSTSDADENTVALTFGPDASPNHGGSVHVGLSDGSARSIRHGDPEKQLPALMPPRP